MSAKVRVEARVTRANDGLYYVEYYSHVLIVGGKHDDMLTRTNYLSFKAAHVHARPDKIVLLSRREKTNFLYIKCTLL